MKRFLLILSMISFHKCFSQTNINPDSLSKKQVSDIADSDDPMHRIIFNKAEKTPSFPGGEKAWAAFLSKELNDSLAVSNGAPAGTYIVVIRFVVSRNGDISDVFAETKFGYGMEYEAARVIKKSPQWIPAEQNGHRVNFYLRQPITFVVTSK